MTLDELKATLAAMTPGPWDYIGTSVVDWDNGTFTMEFMSNRLNGKQTEDARGIAALRNHAAELVARLERATAALREAKAWMMPDPLGKFGMESTPQDRGAECEYLSEAHAMVSSALAELSRPLGEHNREGK